jgi:hypothetical protein
VVGFLREHRGATFASSALMAPMTRQFVSEIERFVTREGVDLVTFEKGQRKDDVAHDYLTGFEEKTTTFRTEKRRNAETGASYPWIVRATAMVNQGSSQDKGEKYISAIESSQRPEPALAADPTDLQSVSGGAIWRRSTPRNQVSRGSDPDPPNVLFGRILAVPHYGQDAAAEILALCQAKVFLGSITDDFTRDYIVELLGRRQQLDDHTRAGRGVDVMTAQALQRTSTGEGLLINGDLPPCSSANAATTSAAACGSSKASSPTDRRAARAAARSLPAVGDLLFEREDLGSRSLRVLLAAVREPRRPVVRAEAAQHADRLPGAVGELAQLQLLQRRGRLALSALELPLVTQRHLLAPVDIDGGS